MTRIEALGGDKKGCRVLDPPMFSISGFGFPKGFGSRVLDPPRVWDPPRVLDPSFGSRVLDSRFSFGSRVLDPPKVLDLGCWIP